MKLTEIDGNIYFFAENKNNIVLDDNATKEFCDNITNLNINDFLEYCKNKKTTTLTIDDFKEYCSRIDLPMPEAITGVGDILIEEDQNTKQESIEQFIDGFTTGSTIKNIANKLNLDTDEKIPCISAIKLLSDELNTYNNDINQLYIDFKDLLNDFTKINYKINVKFTVEKNENHTIINNTIASLKPILNRFLQIDREFETVEVQTNVNLEYGESQYSNIDFANITDEQIDLLKNTTISDTDDIPNVTFTDTKFYILTNEKIQLCNTINEKLVVLNDNTYFIDDTSDIDDLLIECKTIWEYQLNGFTTKLNEIINTCPSTQSTQNIYNNLVNSITNEHPLEITNQEVTIEYRRYWVKFANLLTIISTAGIPFWSTGIITPAGPIKLPTIYINLGVINIKVPLPLVGTDITLPFLIVPFLAITGTIVTPYMLFVNLAPFPVGPIAPNSAVCLFTWRSAFTNLISKTESKELKPLALTSGSVRLDLDPTLTILLSLMIRDDFPVYKRLKLSNIPFVVFSLLKIIQKQPLTTGLP